MKTCSKCIRKKPFSEFARRGSKYQSWCKSCKKLWSAERYQEGYKEKQKAFSKKYNDEHYKDVSDYLKALKSQGCSRCSEDDIRCIEFHHRDPSTKLFTIGKSARRKAWSQIFDELEKCDILCANCHLKTD